MTNMQTKKTYHKEFFNTCELCDLRGEDGKCHKGKDMTCSDGEYYKED